MLNEISQTQKDKYHTFSFICGSQILNFIFSYAYMRVEVMKLESGPGQGKKKSAYGGEAKECSDVEVEAGGWKQGGGVGGEDQ